MITNEQKSKIFKMAWSFLNQNLFKTLSKSLYHAWRRFKIVNRLKSGKVKFTFVKSDGSLRNAIGTLQIPISNTTAKINRFDVVKYFDLTVNAWRSFRIERLIYF